MPSDTGKAPVAPPVAPTLFTRGFRALRMRCPDCGRGSFGGGYLPRASCPVCGIKLGRGESDHFLGSYTLNLLFGLTLAVAMTVLGVRFGGHRPAWVLALIAIAVCIPAIVWFYPRSKLVWLAVDLAFRPPTPADFVAPSERK